MQAMGDISRFLCRVSDLVIDGLKMAENQPRDDHGRFSSTGGGVAVKPNPMDPMSIIRQASERAKLIRTIKPEEIKSNKELGGGMNESRLIEFKNGEKAVFKPEDGEDVGHLHPAFDGASQATREVAVSMIADAMGFSRVAKTEMVDIDGRTGSLQKWVNDGAKKGTDLIHAPIAQIHGTNEMLWFDALIGNADRHYGNWMVKNNEVALIDNGMSLASHTGYSGNTPFGGFIPFRDLAVHEEKGSRLPSLPATMKVGMERLVENSGAVQTKLKAIGLQQPEIESLFLRADYLRKGPSLTYSENLHVDVAEGSIGMEKGFNPNQPRDDHGRFSTTGGSHGPGDVASSPEGLAETLEKSKTMNLDKASKMMDDSKIQKNIKTLEFRMKREYEDLEFTRRAIMHKGRVVDTLWDEHGEVSKGASEVFRKHNDLLLQDKQDGFDSAERFAKDVMNPMAEKVKKAFNKAQKATRDLTSGTHKLMAKHLRENTTSLRDGGGLESIVKGVEGGHPMESYTQAKGFLETTLSSAHQYGMNPVMIEAIPLDREQRSFHTEKSDADFYHSSLNMGNYSGAPMLVHEFGHALETRSEMLAMSRAFLAKRTEGRGFESLKEKFPGHNYNADEVGSEDDFKKAFGAGDGSRARYVGKFYPHAATEIMSMGLEQMYRNPASFAKDDPEYFRYVLGMMKGSLLYGDPPK